MKSLAKVFFCVGLASGLPLRARGETVAAEPPSTTPTPTATPSRTLPEWINVAWRDARAGKWVETAVAVREVKKLAKSLGLAVPAEELLAIREEIARYKLEVLREAAKRGAREGNRGLVRNAIMGSRSLRRRFGVPEIPKKQARLLRNRARRNSHKWPPSKRGK